MVQWRGGTSLVDVPLRGEKFGVAASASPRSIRCRKLVRRRRSDWVDAAEGRSASSGSPGPTSQCGEGSRETGDGRRETAWPMVVADAGGRGALEEGRGE